MKTLQKIAKFFSLSFEKIFRFLRLPSTYTLASIVAIIIALAFTWQHLLRHWNDYFSLPVAGWSDGGNSKRQSLSPLADTSEALTISLDVATFDIATREASILLSVNSPRVFPSNYQQIRYQTMYITNDLGESIVVDLPHADWIQPQSQEEKLIQNYPFRMHLLTWGYYPYEVHELTLHIKVIAEYIDADGKSVKYDPKLGLGSFVFSDTKYQFRGFTKNTLPISGQSAENRDDYQIGIRLGQPGYPRFMFGAFFILISVFTILIVVIKDLSNMLQCVMAIVLGLWGTENLLLPSNLPSDLRYGGEQSIINAYIIVGIAVALWLIKQFVTNMLLQSNNKLQPGTTIRSPRKPSSERKPKRKN